jgi:hypothetical protein
MGQLGGPVVDNPEFSIQSRQRPSHWLAFSLAPWIRGRDQTEIPRGFPFALPL